MDSCTSCTCSGDYFYKQSLISPSETRKRKSNCEKNTARELSIDKLQYVSSLKAFAVLLTVGIGRTVITIFSSLYSNISENADTVCQVQVCEARTCELGFEVMTVTNALPTADNDTCCPKTVCVPLTALQSTALPLTLRPPTSQPMTTWPPSVQPMTARPPCPPLVEPTCGEHQVSRLVTGSSAQHPCSRLVCGTTFIASLNGTFLH
jgi:hypothetical protein